MRNYALFHINACISRLRHCASFHVFMHASIWKHALLYVCVLVVTGALTHREDGRDRGRAEAARLAP